MNYFYFMENIQRFFMEKKRRKFVFVFMMMRKEKLNHLINFKIILLKPNSRKLNKLIKSKI
jgi:fructose-1-phosphate kinase PfkB-like protein